MKKLIVALVLAVLASPGFAEFQPEKLGVVQTLPANYPPQWVVVHDGAFFHMLEGKFVVIDPLADTKGAQFKGFMTGSFMGQFAQSTRRPEDYVAETFYSRGGRGGKRTDVLTIWDRATLKVAGEVVLPPKRSNTMPEKYGLQLLNHEDWAAVFNFTPASSVTLVDLVKRKVIGEVQIPGCALIYPAGPKSFASICSDGTLLTTRLDDNGKAVSSIHSKPLFDSNSDPLFEKPIIDDGVAYFPSFHGYMQPVKLGEKNATAQTKWDLLSGAERKAGWRPSGWQLTGGDGNGKFYIIMNPHGGPGMQKDGGPVIWVYDLKSHKRVQTIDLKTPGISLALTGGKEPVLVVTNRNMKLDVYRADNGKFVRTIDFNQETPFVVYPAK